MQQSLSLDTLAVIKVGVVVNQKIGLIKSLRHMSLDALGPQNGKESFCHCIVNRALRLAIDVVIPYSFVRSKDTWDVYWNTCEKLAIVLHS